MNVFYVCVLVSVSVKAITGMRVEKQKEGYVTFMTLGQTMNGIEKLLVPTLLVPTLLNIGISHRVMQICPNVSNTYLMQLRCI
jgi:hypothetical protein